MKLASSALASIVVLVLSVAVTASADDDKYGCGIFLPDELVSKSNSSAAALNALCSYWQCGRAVPALMASQNNEPSIKFVCARGAEKDAACTTDSDCYHGLTCQNITDEKTKLSAMRCAKAKAASSTTVVGFIAVLGAATFWGSNFVPARAAKMGNGLMFQWWMSCGIMVVGWTATCLIRAEGQPFYVYPSAMVGGMFWAIGNTIGMSALSLLGMLAISIWGAANTVVGSVSSMIGVYGLVRPDLAYPWANFVGLGFAVVSIVLLASAKPVAPPKQQEQQKETGGQNASTPLVSTTTAGAATADHVNARGESTHETAASKNGDVYEDVEESDESNVAPFVTIVGGPARARFAGIFIALTSGVLFGLNNDPVQKIEDNYAELSRTNIAKFPPYALDIVFSHFLGIFFTCMVALLCDKVYSLLQEKGVSCFGRIPKNLLGPEDADLMIRGFASGSMWGIAQVCTFAASQNLSMSIAYPLCSLGPSLLAVCWGRFYFGELGSGLDRNFWVLLFGFIAAAVSAALIVHSKG